MGWEECKLIAGIWEVMEADIDVYKPDRNGEWCYDQGGYESLNEGMHTCIIAYGLYSYNMSSANDNELRR